MRPPPLRRPHIISLKPRLLWRVHAARYAATQCNDSGRGSARFSPLFNATGNPIPTLYLASSFDGAVMETVFHDVPTPPDNYHLDTEILQSERMVVSTMRPTAPIRLVDLSSKGLKRLGYHRSQVIDSSARAYSDTRKIAQALYDDTKAQGLCWTSRQDDEAQAIMLFGDRVGKRALRVIAGSQPLLGDPHYENLILLADRIGITKITEG